MKFILNFVGENWLTVEQISLTGKNFWGIWGYKIFIRNLFLLCQCNSSKLNKKIIIIPVIVFTILVILTTSSQSNQQYKKNDPVFHVTLANPNQYPDGVYSSIFVLEKGEYSFSFVPNGDSPQNLGIKLKGKTLEFSENFNLNGILHESGISKYYTWNYNGSSSFQVDTQQEVSIEINPNGNVMGSVSVGIVQN